MIRDVMLALTDTAADEAALAAAIALVETLDARLSVAVPLDSPLAASATYGVSPIVLEQSVTALREAALRRAAHVREQLVSRSFASDVRVTESHTSGVRHLLAHEARYADLVVVAAPGATSADADLLHAAFATLLFESGRPVLAIPHAGTPRFPVRRAVVAWKPTPEAARAVHDALALLPAGCAVDVVVVEPTIGDRGHGEEPGADIAAHLARHGLTVAVHVHDGARGTTASDVLLAAVESGADLLVAGGYGHSRAREWAFGGTTRNLLRRCHVPVLFSH